MTTINSRKLGRRVTFSARGSGFREDEMTPELLIECGRALYGQQWQSPLARDLGVSDRTIRRWVAGQFPVPDGVAADLRRLCVARGAQLRALAAALRAHA